MTSDRQSLCAVGTPGVLVARIRRNGLLLRNLAIAIYVLTLAAALPATQQPVTRPLPSVDICRSDPAECVEDYYKSRIKRYWIIVSDRSDAGAFPGLAEGNVPLLKQVFDHYGYQPLDAPLIGKAVTSHAIKEELRTRVATVSDRHWIVVYYSGHARIDNGDLELELSGDRYTTIRDLLQASVGGVAFRGHLFLIIDACYSGEGLNPSAYSLSPEQQGRVSILASSGPDQQSFTFRPGNGPHLVSVFAYIFNHGIEHDWNEVSGQSGMIDFDNLKNYETFESLKLASLHRNLRQMTAQDWNPTSYFLLYNKNRDHNPVNSRDLIISGMILDRMLGAVPRESDVGAKSLRAPPLSEHLKSLALLIKGTDDRPYVQVARALAQGHYDQASQLLQVQYGRAAGKDQKAYTALLIARDELYGGKPHESARWYETARSLNGPGDIGICIETARAYMQANDWSKAQSLLEYSYKASLINERKGSDLAALAGNNLAFVYENEGKLSESLKLLKKETKTAKRAGNTRWAAVSSANAGIIQSTSDNPKAALKSYRRAIGLFNKTIVTGADLQVVVNFQKTLTDYSGTLKSLGKLDEARAAQSRAAAIGSLAGADK